MAWLGVEGHDEIVAGFRRALERGRLAGAFLFVGPEGVGKRTFALKLAQTLLCERRPEAQMDPCGECPGCAQVLAGSHPDLDVVGKPPDKSTLPLEVFIGAGERRMREGLCHRISLKPMRGRRKVAVVDDADYLAAEGANCLLKTLEEPPPGSVLILLGTSPEKQLPTIRSRCQLIRFAPLPPETLSRVLLRSGLAADEEQARRMARHADGGVTSALDLADEELWQFRQRLLGELSRPSPDTVSLAGATTAFVDEAGKEAPPRRNRARQLVAFAVDYYRQLARVLGGGAPQADEELSSLVARAAQSWAAQSWPGDAETAIRCAERCLECLEHIDRNANLATALECWLDDLSQLASPRPAPVG